MFITVFTTARHLLFLSQINPVLTTPPYILFLFSYTLPSTSSLPSEFFPPPIGVSPPNLCISSPPLSKYATRCTHLIFLGMMGRVSGGKIIREAPHNAVFSSLLLLSLSYAWLSCSDSRSQTP